jgi:3-dehydroquinate dehydratase/shikimate dehydrogenase
MARASIVASLTAAPSSDGREIPELGPVAEWLEVRADQVGDFDPGWLRSLFPGNLLYSLRSRAAGGEFAGSAAERSSRIRKAARAYDMVELEAGADLEPATVSEIPPGKRMASWYGSIANRGELEGRLHALSTLEARTYKIVVTGGRGSDAVAPLCLLNSLGRSDIVAYASGESGLWARLVAPQFGAPLIFASASRSPNADGEPSASRLIDDYGLPSLSRIEEIYGIVGNPVRHSLSPRIHNAAYRALGYPALFVPFLADSFGDFCEEVATNGQLESLGLRVKGLTVASPHKEDALSQATQASVMARRAGAANVFVRENGHWRADTTDPDGVKLILKRGISLRGKRAAVVGCGGAGRAVAAALRQSGCDVTLVNRGLNRGQFASGMLGLPFVKLSSFRADGFSILVNATPVGRDEDELPFDTDRLSEEGAVVDLAYGSKPTTLAARSRASGRAVIDGLDVLEAQVLRQFRIMTGKKMPAAGLAAIARANV